MNQEQIKEAKLQLANYIRAERRYRIFLHHVGVGGSILKASEQRLSLRCYDYNKFCLENPDRGLDQTEV
jgi:hypothetical protein